MALMETLWTIVVTVAVLIVVVRALADLVSD